MTVFYIGQISANKGVDLLVDVALRLVVEYPVRFLIAGDYSWKNPMAQALIQKVGDLGLQDRIVFTGFVDDIDPLYAQSHVHVAPSVLEEAYGLTVVEAKKHSLPSIVFPSGGSWSWLSMVEKVGYVPTEAQRVWKTRCGII